MTQPEQPLPVPAPSPGGAEPAISRTGATAGQVPTLQAGGTLAFATVAAGGGGGRWAVKPPSGFWTGSTLFTGNNQSPVMALGAAYYCPMIFDDANTFTAIGTYNPNALAGQLIRLGLYGAGAGGYPGALIVDAGTVDFSTGGSKSVSVTSFTLQPGIYWCAAAAQGTVGGAIPNAGGSLKINFGLAAPTIGNNPGDIWNGSGSNSIRSTVSVTGAFPATATAAIEQGVANRPIMCLLVA